MRDVVWAVAWCALLVAARWVGRRESATEADHQRELRRIAEQRAKRAEGYVSILADQLAGRTQVRARQPRQPSVVEVNPPAAGDGQACRSPLRQDRARQQAAARRFAEITAGDAVWGRLL